MVFSFLFSFLFSFSVANPSATSNIRLPEEIQINRTFERLAGSNAYTVTLIIHARGISGFARHTEFFPSGVKATILKDAGSSARIDNDKMKFIWVSFPSDPEIKISYTITFPDNLLIIYYRGEFTYLGDNQAKTYKLEPKDVNVIGN
jgi:hypothetical protein